MGTTNSIEMHSSIYDYKFANPNGQFHLLLKPARIGVLDLHLNHTLFLSVEM